MPDLNSLFRDYLVTLKAAAPAAVDVTTLVANDLATVRAAAAPTDLDDVNTMYKLHLD